MIISSSTSPLYRHAVGTLFAQPDFVSRRWRPPPTHILILISLVVWFSVSNTDARLLGVSYLRSTSPSLTRLQQTSLLFAKSIVIISSRSFEDTLRYFRFHFLAHAFLLHRSAQKSCDFSVFPAYCFLAFARELFTQKEVIHTEEEGPYQSPWTSFARYGVEAAHQRPKPMVSGTTDRTIVTFFMLAFAHFLWQFSHFWQLLLPLSRGMASIFRRTSE